MQTFVIKRPVISEKSVVMAQTQNKYTFEVDRLANKDQIKAAIEALYGVHVVAINTIRGHRTTVSTGKKRSKTLVAPTKKAIIELKAGQKIDIFEFGSAEVA